LSAAVLDVFAFGAAAEEAANKCSEKTKECRKYVGDSINLSLETRSALGTCGQISVLVSCDSMYSKSKKKQENRFYKTKNFLNDMYQEFIQVCPSKSYINKVTMLYFIFL